MLASDLLVGKGELPKYEILNNGVLSGVMASPAKDLNVFHESEFVMGRKEFIQRFSSTPLFQTKQKWLNGTAVPFVSNPMDITNIGKKWTPNANRDASAIVAKEKSIGIGKATLNASGGALSYGNHNVRTIQQDVSRERARLRSSGNCAPAKCRASTNTCNSTPVFLSGPVSKSTTYMCGPAPLEKLRGPNSVSCQTEANKKAGIKTYSTPFYPLGRFQTWIAKPVPVGLYYIPLPSH
jgi:hypothetical protein